MSAGRRAKGDRLTRCYREAQGDEPMNRLRSTFAGLSPTGRKVLLPYVTGGFPDVATTIEILRRIEPNHCGAVEIGIPFSDPIADGPVIQASFSAAREAGFEGLIVPDLALEEAEDFAALARRYDCALVMIIAPTTTDERQRKIAALSDPFIYYQSLAGVTGERASLPPDLARHVAQLRRATDKPICVGFGISTPAHVRAVCEVADGAIVGSAIVRRMNAAVERGDDRQSIAAEISAFIRALGAELEPPRHRAAEER